MQYSKDPDHLGPEAAMSGRTVASADHLPAIISPFGRGRPGDWAHILTKRALEAHSLPEIHCRSMSLAGRDGNKSGWHQDIGFRPDDFREALRYEGNLDLYTPRSGRFLARLTKVVTHRLSIMAVAEQLPRIGARNP